MAERPQPRAQERATERRSLIPEGFAERQAEIRTQAAAAIRDTLQMRAQNAAIRQENDALRRRLELNASQLADDARSADTG
jgi:hypothetical protein